MLDLASIMFSSIMLLFILLRALRLDKHQPWFPPVKLTASAPVIKPVRQRR